MTNIPSRVGERWRCFVLIRDDRGWGGPYGQRRMPAIWKCEDCGYQIPGELASAGYAQVRAADHHECGHAPCERCGVPLLRRKDGTPRQHAHHLCAGKDPGHKIEREFVRHMSTREFA